MKSKGENGMTRLGDWY